MIISSRQVNLKVQLRSHGLDSKSPLHLLCETKDGLFLVIGIGAETLDVHTAAQTL